MLQTCFFPDCDGVHSITAGAEIKPPTNKFHLKPYRKHNLMHRSR